MKVEHTLEVTALCPVDGLPDVYTVTVRVARVVKVEDILAVAAPLAQAKLFQQVVYRDDGQVIDAYVHKRFCRPGEFPRAEITVRARLQ